MQKHFFLILAAVLFITGCEQNISTENKEPLLPIEPIPTVQNGTVVEGHLRIKATQEITDLSDLQAQFPTITLLSMARTFPYSPTYEARTRANGLHLWYDITFDPTTPATKAAAAFTHGEGIQHVEYIHRMKPTAETSYPFNDPYLSYQWHYHNTGSITGESVAGCDINLFNAWGLCTGHNNVIVAVVDSGVEWDHEDLKDNMWSNPLEVNGITGIDDDGNGYIDDLYGYNFCMYNNGEMVGTIAPENHGTHVAGTISAINNNGIGLCGIAGGNGITPGVRIMTCQTLEEGFDYAATERAIKYAADNGAVICQNSWGYDDPEAFPQSVKEAIDYFIAYAGVDANGNQTGPMRGGIVLFAAGNDNITTNAVCSYDKVMSVAAIGPDFSKASYSNYGDWVDIAAPGGDQSGNTIYFVWSTVVDDNYVGLTGTSMACPHVSGVAALAVSLYGKEGFTNTMLWDLLLNTATPIDAYNPAYVGLLGKGLVDAYKCLLYSEPTPPYPVDAIWTSALSNAITLDWQVPSSANGEKAFGYAIYYSRHSLQNLDPTHLPNDVYVAHVRTGQKNVGDTLTTTFTDLDFFETYYFRMASYDILERYAPLSPEVAQTTQDNRAPVITPKEGTSVTVKAFETKTLSFAIEDPDGHPMTYSFESQSNAVTASRSGDVIKLSLNGLKETAGTYAVILTVSDPYDQTTLPITFTVLPNAAPHVIATPDPVYLKSKAESIQLNMLDYFKDEDGEPLSYSITSSSSSVIVNSSFSGDKLTIQGNWYGSTTLTLTAKDARGAQCETSFPLLYRDGSRPVDLYPNPVSDVLHIRLGEEAPAKIAIYAVSGAKVYEASQTTSPFQPVQVDVTSWESGTYTVIIDRNGTTLREHIVKI